MMGAPIKHTCPDIDRAIKHFKTAIWEARCNIDDKQTFNSIEWELEQAIGYFEDLRKSNAALRDWGEGLENNLESAASEISRLEDLSIAS